jgi:large subunit ribosomal protein L17
MRHSKKWRKLGRKNDHYTALARNLTIGLFRHERIFTTEEKAKEFRSFAEHLITLAKTPSLHRYRLCISRLGDENITQKLFKKIAPLFNNRAGGYTRIIKLGGSRLEKTKTPGRFSHNRLGDNAKRVIWELVEKTKEKTEKKTKEKTKKQTADTK